MNITKLNNIKSLLELTISQSYQLLEEYQELKMFGAKSNINYCITHLENELHYIKGCIEKESKL